MRILPIENSVTVGASAKYNGTKVSVTEAVENLPPAMEEAVKAFFFRTDEGNNLRPYVPGECDPTLEKALRALRGCAA